MSQKTVSFSFSRFSPGNPGSRGPPLPGLASCLLSPTLEDPRLLFCCLPVHRFDLLRLLAPGLCGRSTSNCSQGLNPDPVASICQQILHTETWDLFVRRSVLRNTLISAAMVCSRANSFRLDLQKTGFSSSLLEITQIFYVYNTHTNILNL